MARYGKKAQSKVKKAMHERKAGTLKSGRSGKKVKSRKQAIAIGLSEARKAGGKVPKKSSSSKKTLHPNARLPPKRGLHPHGSRQRNGRLRQKGSLRPAKRGRSAPGGPRSVALIASVRRPHM